MAALTLPIALQEQIARDAFAALPNECCGLIEGARDGDTFKATALYLTLNLATESDRFEIDPAEQFNLMRTLRGTGRKIIGCYHSHPNGKAEPSARDAESAFDEHFVWLVAGVTIQGSCSLSAHIREAGEWRKLALNRTKTHS
jgi:proteasome lid subunit RPN8/RPN11